MQNISAIFDAVFSMFKWWFVIAPWEQAIRVRGGKEPVVLGPGIYFRIPGLDRFFVQSVRRRFMNTPTQAITTRDGKALTVSGGTSYSIQDIGKLYNSLHAADDVIQTETMAIVAKFITANDLIDCTPLKIQESVVSSLNLSRYGLSEVEYFVTDLVCVRTFRIINNGPKDYGGDMLDTINSNKV